MLGRHKSLTSTNVLDGKQELMHEIQVISIVTNNCTGTAIV